MKKAIIAFLLAAFMVLGAFNGTFGAEGDETYYWARGQKIYIDPIPDTYLAIHGTEKQAQSFSSYDLGGKSLQVIDTPEEIKLPPDASLVQAVEKTEDDSRQNSVFDRPIRCLVPAFRDRKTQAMILPLDMVIVKFRDDVSREDALAFIEQAGLIEPEESEYVPNQFIARDPLGGLHPLRTANELYELPEVDFAHPDFIQGKTVHFIPNDPLYTYQWHLNNTGSGGGTPGADINAEAAWNITRGALSTKIAIVDDGVQWDHEDLSGNYLGGYNFEDDDADPYPEAGENHGTAVAGLAVGKGNNATGISGSCPDCGLVGVAYSDSSTSQDANMYFWQNNQGVAVSSNSWSYTNKVLPDVVANAIEVVTTTGRGGWGMIILVAAGNEDEQIASTSMAAHPNVITVGASTANDLRASYSNFGPALDIVSPGGDTPLDTRTTDRYPGGYNTGMEAGEFFNDRYTNAFSGTSAATPVASGVVGLMLTANPWMTRKEVMRSLFFTCDKVGDQPYPADGRNDRYGYGRINAYKAVISALNTRYKGWWYNPAENGSGISIEIQGSTLFMAWYAYDKAGRPTWITSNGTMNDSTNYTGFLWVWNGWQLGGPHWDPVVSPAGSVNITFTSSTDATMNYAVSYMDGSVGSGQIPITKFLDHTVGGVRDLRDYIGWWWDPSFNGMGVFMEIKGNTLFAGWYHYRDDTTGRWWSAGGPFLPGQVTFTGTLQEFTDGQCYGCYYTPPDLPESKGPVTIQFTDESRATLSKYGLQDVHLERFIYGNY